jgi:hypothetical protein
MVVKTGLTILSFSLALLASCSPKVLIAVEEDIVLRTLGETTAPTFILVAIKL